MIATAFDEENCVLVAPSGQEEVHALSTFCGKMDDGTPVVISCWKVTKNELEMIQKTGRVWLMIMGQTMPPSHVTAVNPFKEG